MIQNILVCLLFLAALIYISTILYKKLRPAKGGCGEDCKCSFQAGKAEALHTAK